jgi:hypothetical protein
MPCLCFCFNKEYAVQNLFTTWYIVHFKKLEISANGLSKFALALCIAFVPYTSFHSYNILYYTGPHIHNLCHNKSAFCCFILHIRKPQRSLLHPTYESGLCDNLQMTHHSWMSYSHTTANEMYRLIAELTVQLLHLNECPVFTHVRVCNRQKPLLRSRIKSLKDNGDHIRSCSELSEWSTVINLISI